MGYTALHSAAAEGHLEVVNVLLGRGARILTVKSMRETALHMTAQSLDTEIEVLKLLLERYHTTTIFSLRPQHPRSLQ